MQRDVSLKPHSTMRLEAVGAELHVPESLDELCQVRRLLASQGRSCHWLGAGSNVVFAERVETPVVSLMKVDESIVDLGDGRFRAGCSARIQRLIRFAQKRGFGGIEYLFSLPASFGGCVFMNAGRGHGNGPAIADVLEEVELMDWETGEIRREPVDRAAFGYRRSPYQKRKCVILGATIRLIPQPPEETERKIRIRLDTSRKHLDAGLPSCGSVFCKGNKVVFRVFRWLHPRAGNLAFSAKTSNWIGNRGGGTLSDFKRLVAKMERVHRAFGQKCELEIRIFE
jgi:UDP-N-acetylmuramate dehydrogenase